jgi:hypothetical protein
MEKKQILGAIVVFILVLCILFFNYKSLDRSTGNNGSKNNSGHDPIVKHLLDNISGKMCCEEIGGTISGKSCVFEDLDGTELEINYRYLEDYNGKNYCTDEYFDRK